MTNILVVDDDQNVRDMLTLILDDAPDIVITGEASNGKSALEKVKETILKRLVELPSPMTFIFDGHSGPETLVLSDRPRVAIKVDELAEKLKERSRRGDLP